MAKEDREYHAIEEKGELWLQDRNKSLHGTQIQSQAQSFALDSSTYRWPPWQWEHLTCWMRIWRMDPRDTCMAFHRARAAFADCMHVANERPGGHHIPVGKQWNFSMTECKPAHLFKFTEDLHELLLQHQQNLIVQPRSIKLAGS